LHHAERVWDLQQELIAIARQHLDDVRMLPIFLDVIDDRADALATFRSTDFLDLPPGLYVPCEPGKQIIDKNGPRIVASDARTCPFGTYRTIVAKLNLDLMMHYAEAIEVLVKNRDFASQELRDLEKRALQLPFAGFNRCSGGTLDAFLAMELVDSCLEP